MFYEPDKDNHGLPFNPYKAIVVPRPIGWVSTVSHDDVPNLAPYSQFNNLGYDPPYVMFAANCFPGSGRRKDSVKNATDTGEFVINMATYDLREAVSTTSRFVEPQVDESRLAGLEMIPSRIVRPRRVAASPVHLECRVHCSLVLPGHSRDQTAHVVIGRVVGVHIRDDALTPDGRIDVLRLRPLARLGYFDYTSVESMFTMPPDGPEIEARLAGFAGRPARSRPASVQSGAAD